MPLRFNFLSELTDCLGEQVRMKSRNPSGLNPRLLDLEITVITFEPLRKILKAINNTLDPKTLCFA